MNKNIQTITLAPKILTKDNFSTFGDVIEVGEDCQNSSINDGYTRRYHDLAKIDVVKNGGRVLVNVFRSSPLPLPIVIKKMESHPLSSQCFIPLGIQPYLVVVAPAGKFDPTKIEIFIASSKQGVNYHTGTWHHFSLALKSVSDFLVIDRGNNCENSDAENGQEDNCHENNLDPQIIIDLSAIGDVI